jgi:hypothetical protein
MTLNELLEQCKELVDAGFGDSVVIKASDGEGNDFISVGSIQNDRATGGPYRFEVISEEDEEDYEEYEEELISVICVW